MHARDSLLGQSIHCGTLAVLVASSLAQWGLLRKLPSLEELDLANLRKDRDEGRPSSARRLARMYASYATHRGNEIRLEAGPRRMLQKPSWQQVDARQWTWQTVISCVWQIEGESMPSLEARAVLLTLQWRARSVARLGKKFLHLSDSQSALGCMSKHRSGATSLAYLVERAAALQLAGNMEPVFAFVRTHINPADRPSRRKNQVKKAPKIQSMTLCAAAKCLKPGNSKCDNCGKWFCPNHTYIQNRRGTKADLETICMTCRSLVLHYHGAPQLPQQKLTVGEGAATA